MGSLLFGISTDFFAYFDKKAMSIHKSGPIKSYSHRSQNGRISVVILQIIAVGLVYFVTGKIGNYLAIPPNYATVVWPPSGIALAALLILGYRVWPGIFLGSYLVNLSILLTKTAFDLSDSSIYFGLVTGGGATIQALIGAYTVKRLAGFPNPLITEKQVFLFLLFGGVFSCVINSTLSIACLSLLGQIADENIVTDWVTWWLGDSIGVFIFAPLMLVWFGRPKLDFVQRRQLVTTAYVLTFGLTMSIVLISAQREAQRFRSEFDRDAQYLTFAMQKSTQAFLHALSLINSFFAASDNVERAEFKIFADHFLQQIHGIQALEWAPIIKNAARHVFETKMQAEGYSQFTISELDNFKHLIPASNRSEYLPVTFMAPYSGNQAILGYDHYSNPLSREALVLARDSGQMIATPRFKLIQEQAEQSGVIVFAPIYRNHSILDSLKDRQNNLVGYLIAEFRSNDFITNALKEIKPESLNYKLVDFSVSENPQVVFSNQHDETASLKQLQKGFFGRNFFHQQTTAINFAGRHWQFEITPTLDYLRTHHSYVPWALFTSGLLLTSVIGAFALVTSGRGDRLRKLVDERTQALKSSETWLHAIIEKNPECISLSNHQGDIVKLNYAGLAIFEADHAGQIIGLPLENFIAPEFCSLYHQTHQRLIGGETVNMEFEIIGLKGGRRWLDSHFVAIKQANGEVFHLVVARDISQRKTLEFTLAKDRIRFQMLFELSPVGMALVDHQSGHFLDVNQSLLNSVGYCKDEFLALSFWQITPPEYNDQEAEQIKALNISGRFGPNQKEYIRKDGSRFPIAISGFLHTDTSGRKVVWGIIEDISERVRHELALLQAKEAAEALADSKAKFLANMSHEIRTPMNGIIGLTLLALNEQTSPQVRDYLLKISTSSHCLLDILNDILDFSKIEAGQMTIDAVPFALDSLVSNLSNLYEGSATSKQLGFSVEVADGIPPQLIGDIVRLQQILSNLIGNAIKFTSHGHVALKIRLKQFNDAQVVLVFAVEDTGIGISDLDQSKLFQSFSQVDGAITRKFGGTGLGLAISQRLLNLMGTACQVKSKPGQGAIFSFELCLGVAANMPVLETSRSKIPMPGGLEQELKLSLNPIQGARILLVEDNRINQLVVKKFLELSRLEVTLANNGLEAINLLENSDFDAILMDVHMPVMDGIEATKLIIETGKHPHLPIIALTAGVTSEEREACAESGMCDFIAKPVHSEILASKLLKWVKK